MTHNFRPRVQELNFNRQLKQYIISAQQLITKLIAAKNCCRSYSNSQSPIRQIAVMQNRINLAVSKYKQVLAKMEKKVINNGGIKSLKSYFTSDYQTLIRQAHQLLSMCGNQVKLPQQQDFKKIKILQEQMNLEWERGQSNTKNKKFQKSRSHFHSYQVQMNEAHSQIQINRKKASAHMQQEFLAIRMIAYQLYEKHNGHHHQKLHQEVITLQQEQSKLEKQLAQMQEIRLNLLAQQSKLQTELKELKKINELIGRRYFIEENNQAN